MRTTKSTVEPWFVAYALVGAVAAGLAPLLLPLWVSRGSTAAHVGLVMAALSFGQLSAPLWGQLADKWRAHAQLFVGGLALTGLALASVSLTHDPYLLVAESLVLGLGIAATTTVANLFIVERYPRESWSVQLGSLQTAYALGQVGGFVVAGLLSGLGLGLAIGITALLPFIAMAFGRSLPRVPGSGSRPRFHLALHLNVEPLFGSLAHAYHLVHVGKAIRALRRAPAALLRFQLLWFVINTGSSFIFSFYPLLLARLYGVPTERIAWAYAAAAGVGLLLYGPAGAWVEKSGCALVLRAGIAFRVIMLAGLAGVALLPLADRGLLALALFGGIVLAWSLISVAGTTLAADSALSEGEAMGLFSANGALAGVSGALLGGVLVRYFGYVSLPLAALALLIVGMAISRAVPEPSPPEGRSEGESVHLDPTKQGDPIAGTTVVSDVAMAALPNPKQGG
ncbi:MAG: MFS transporter [Trueperaceae bacterium]